MLEQRPEGIGGGVAGAKVLGSARERPARARNVAAARVSRPRESQRWAEVLEQVGGHRRRAANGSMWRTGKQIFTSRSSAVSGTGSDFVMRGYRDRAAGQGARSICWRAVEQAPVLGRMTDRVAGSAWASRLGVAHGGGAGDGRASCRGRGDRWGCSDRMLNLNVVEVRELAPPPGVEPLHWLLLTSLPCERRGPKCKRVVGRYAARWWIEEYHKALKTRNGRRRQPIGGGLPAGKLAGGVGHRGGALVECASYWPEPARRTCGSRNALGPRH